MYERSKFIMAHLKRLDFVCETAGRTYLQVLNEIQQSFYMWQETGLFTFQETTSVLNLELNLTQENARAYSERQRKYLGEHIDIHIYFVK